MKIKKVITLLIAFSVLISLMTVQQIFAAEVDKMSKEELKSMIDKPDVVIIDVRSGRDWKSSESKIKNAVREEPWKGDSWAGKYDKSKIYVLYCA